MSKSLEVSIIPGGYLVHEKESLIAVIEKTSLIAAAPDLLSACESAISFLHKSRCLPSTRKAIDALQSAIDKANLTPNLECQHCWHSGTCCRCGETVSGAAHGKFLPE